MASVEPQLKNWSRDEYERMGAAGLFVHQRVELVDGEILAMSPMKALHATGTELTATALRAAFGRGHWIRVQLPLAICDDSEPEPDVAVVPGTPRDFSEHPSSALLIVEVSDTTLAFDRGRKRRLYADASVAEYWILNLIERQLEVHRDPSDGDFRTATILGPSADITPLAAPGSRVRVRDLLP